MRFIRAVKTLAGLLAVIFVGVTVFLFVCLPRVVNMLADLFGTGAEEFTHWIPAIVIDILLLILAYFWVWRPWRRFTYAQEAQGLVVYRGQGRAYMDTESVRQQVYAAVSKVPDIQRVEVTINNDLGRAAVQLNVLTGNDINGPKKKQEISREIKKVVQDQLGVQLAGEPMINMSLTPIAGEVPHVTPSVAPQVTKSPTSPRTVAEPVRTSTEPSRPVAEQTRRPIITPAPPRSEPVPPVETKSMEPVEVRTSEAVTVTPEPPPPPKTDEVTTPAETSAPGQSPDSPITGSRPFSRRPFVPPAGSNTLPDLPPRPPGKPPEERPEEPSTSAMAGDESANTTTPEDKTDTMSNQE